MHGLTGNAFNTWYHRGSQTHWPSQLLPADIPSSRILSFGYDARVATIWSPPSSNRLNNHAENLVGELVTLREESASEERRIIFVAHSLGGLVVQSALSHSRNSFEEHLHQLDRYTIGIGKPLST